MKLEVEKLLQTLHDKEAETIILEPQSVFNKGIIGYQEVTNQLIYSYDLLVESLANDALENQEIDEDEAQLQAIEWLNYNTLGVAPNYPDYPLIIQDISSLKELISNPS